MTIKQEDIIKKMKLKKYIDEQIITENINNDEYNKLEELYSDKIHYLLIAKGKHELIENIKNDNTDIDKKTIKFYIKNNLNSEKELTENDFKKINKTEEEYIIYEPKKIKFTINLDECKELNNKLENEILKLKKKRTKNNKQLIDNKIDKIKLEMPVEFNNNSTDKDFKKLKNEYLLLQYESFYGDKENMDAVGLRKSWVLNKLNELCGIVKLNLF